MAIIYKATNKINGKAYIGYDSNWPKRKNAHKHYSQKESDNKPYFHKAILKYGWDNFEWSVIKENATKDDETLLIEKYETFYTTGKGYNLTKGGDGIVGYYRSEETKRKIGEKNKNRIFTEEHKKKLSNSHKGISSHKKGKSLSQEIKKKISESLSGKNHPQYGKKVSEETRKKISQANKECIPWNKGKKGLQVPWNKGKKLKNENIIVDKSIFMK